MPRRKRAVEVEEGPPAARRFEGALDRLLRVSKEELAKREAGYQQARAAKKGKTTVNSR